MYSLRGACDSASTEVILATFWGEGLGSSGWIRVRTAVTVPTTVPTAAMIGIGRFHHGVGGGLARLECLDGDLEGWLEFLLLRLVMASPNEIFAAPRTLTKCNRPLSDSALSRYGYR